MVARGDLAEGLVKLELAALLLHLHLDKALLAVTEELRLVAGVVVPPQPDRQVLAAMVVMAGLRRHHLFLEHLHITQVVAARQVIQAAQMD